MTAGDILIIGDGVIAWACARALALAGRRVLVVGAGTLSASAAAAGMIAPASEAVLDGVEAATAALWRESAACWGDLASRLKVDLRCTGAVHLAADDELERRRLAALRLGFAATDASQGLFFPQDRLLDAVDALDRLRRSALEAGASHRCGRVSCGSGGLLLGAEPLRAGLTIVAAGWGAAALSAWAPELASLRPIKGQLLRMEASGAAGPVIRAPGAYLAPQPWGWCVGATMEEGRADLIVDPARSAELLAAAAAVKPQLTGAHFTPVVGVRAATLDQAPLVGPSRRPGVLLATGMRRNGWLLAPLVARTIAAYEAGDPHAVLGGQVQAWAPGRVLQTP